MQLPGVNRRVADVPPPAKTFIELLLVTTDSSNHVRSSWGGLRTLEPDPSEAYLTSQVKKGVNKSCPD